MTFVRFQLVHGGMKSVQCTFMFSLFLEPVITPTSVVVENVGKTFVILSWSFDIHEILNNSSKLRGEFKGFKVSAGIECVFVLTEVSVKYLAIVLVDLLLDP